MNKIYVPTYVKIYQKNRIIKHLPFMLELYKKLQHSFFIDEYNCENVATLNIDIAKNNYHYYEIKCPRLWEMVGKIVQSNYKKRQRVANRFEKMFDNCNAPIYFGTLTFTNETLDNTAQKTRRIYVSRFLKNISQDYLANIDFGDLTNREHYHTIFSCSDIELFKQWKYGFVNVKRVVFSNKNKHNLSNYVVKLINHCVKGSAGFLISSRKKKR